eukprot:3410440-Prymnesium_polylepis.1
MQAWGKCMLVGQDNVHTLARCPLLHTGAGPLVTSRLRWEGRRRVLCVRCWFLATSGSCECEGVMRVSACRMCRAPREKPCLRLGVSVHGCDVGRAEDVFWHTAVSFVGAAGWSAGRRVSRAAVACVR